MTGMLLKSLRKRVEKKRCVVNYFFICSMIRKLVVSVYPMEVSNDEIDLHHTRTISYEFVV